MNRVIARACPLCRAETEDSFFRDKSRDYFRCTECCLVFVPPDQFLPAEEEKSRYDLHENHPADPGYRKFLSRICVPVLERLAAGSCGLDFGSGPGPTLSVMFEEAGHTVSLYDRYYANDPSVLEKQYDFITATEVLEHLHAPREELDRLWSCLRPGGILGVMTRLAPDTRSFPQWHYIRDLTHVCFFSCETLEWVAARWKADLDLVAEDAAIFRKKQ